MASAIPFPVQLGVVGPAILCQTAFTRPSALMDSQEIIHIVTNTLLASHLHHHVRHQLRQ